VLTKEAEIPLCEAVKLLSKNPARVMGLDTKGELNAGMDADIVIFDEDINVKGVIVGGETVI
jgi:N-acetylglucosamine-6-phosphate deacetylase